MLVIETANTHAHTYTHTLFIYENTAMKHFSLPTKWNQLIRFTSLNDNRVYIICIIIYMPPKVKYMHIFTTTTYRKEICKLSAYITHEYLPPPIFTITNGAFMTSFPKHCPLRDSQMNIFLFFLFHFLFNVPQSTASSSIFTPLMTAAFRTKT